MPRLISFIHKTSSGLTVLQRELTDEIWEFLLKHNLPIPTWCEEEVEVSSGIMNEIEKLPP